ncbi:MAG TPA: polymer-forming cytoskeletal protein [Thermoanaerobaculia bacterium]|jgi:cytoskeletal protein CcmA (bactofilin family)
MKIKPEGATLNGFLDKGSHFQGDLEFEETFRIDGKFEGKIRSGAELILGDSAEVSGQIEVGRLSVNGALKGTVRARERIELHARARVEADLTTPVLKIEEGARFEGSCKMGDEAKSNVVDLPAAPRRP